MKSQVFTGVEPVISGELAPAGIVDYFLDEGYFHAAVLQEGGVTADTVMDLASRFAILCTYTYGEATYDLRVDRAHPNISVDCEELEEILASNPGDTIPTPAASDIFRQLFETVATVDLTIKPVVTNPGMPHTFAKVSWNRNASNFLSFYAQGSRTVTGDDFVNTLYERMFYVPESAPKKGMQVALGILATSELERYAVGNEQYRKHLLERYNNNSRIVGENSLLGFPAASLLESSRPALVRGVRSLFNKFKKLL